MDWTEYANATSRTGIWIGVTADGLAAEVVETSDGWRWRIREIGVEGRDVIADGRHATADEARLAAEWAARSERCAACGHPLEQVEIEDISNDGERCTVARHVCGNEWCSACGAPMEQIEMADGTAEHACSRPWTCPSQRQATL